MGHEEHWLVRDWTLRSRGWSGVLSKGRHEMKTCLVHEGEYRRPSFLDQKDAVQVRLVRLRANRRDSSPRTANWVGPAEPEPRVEDGLGLNSNFENVSWAWA